MSELEDVVDGARLSLYLLPTELSQNEANEKARPGETPERREMRVVDMVASLTLNGQNVPVLVTEVPGDGEQPATYEYIDGGSRVDALNRMNIADGGQRKVWCTLVAPDSDFFRTAVTSNMHRIGNTVLEYAAICQETADRHGWKGRGASNLVAEYLGMLPSRVSEYKKVAQAAIKHPKVKSMLDDGSIVSLDAALKLISVPDELRDEVGERATAIANMKAAEATPAPAPGKAGKADADAGKADAAPAPAPGPARVTADNVAQAARETGATAGPRNRRTIVEFFSEKVGPAYTPAIQKFCEYFTETWCPGGGTDRRANKLFDEMVGSTPVVVEEPVVESPPKKPMGKAASKAVTKAVAKKASKKASK